MRQTLARRRVLLTEDNADYRRDQSDPFGEDFYLAPHAEEVWARSEQLAADNQDALRHFVELAIWEALDNPDLLKILSSLLWLWDAIDPRWLAEASFRSVSDVRDLVDSQPVMTFNCLDCGAELNPMNRRHLLRMHHSLNGLGRDESGDHLTDLLCKRCTAQRSAHAEEQRRLDELRQRALLAENRGRPYAERRQTKEWEILKRQVHRRDGYRCRLCGRDDIQLHVHHRTYETYAEERLEDLITLCRTCHEHFHFLSEAS
jgi:5-methylcytosine-specific restriction endonuclease McrA